MPQQAPAISTEHLPEGTQILKSRSISGHLVLVLALRPATEYQRYVTWIHNTQDGGFYGGHYFNTLPVARADYEVRSW